MKRIKRVLTLAALAAGLALLPQQASAQGRPDFANMDPQQIQKFIQQRLLDNCRQQLDITNDADWGAIEPRLSKVVSAKMETMATRIGGMMRGRGGPEGGRGFPGFGAPNPEAEALQKLVDDHAPASQIKPALARFREAQERKEAELKKAQDALREVITVRQEAVLVAMSMLD